MNVTSDAADQVMRIALDGTEKALNITGRSINTAAKMISGVVKTAVNAKKKLEYTSNGSTGRDVKMNIFEIKNEKLRQFCSMAKRYNIKYTLVTEKKHNEKGVSEVIVKNTDSPVINHILERIDCVDKGIKEKNKFDIPEDIKGLENIKDEGFLMRMVQNEETKEKENSISDIPRQLKYKTKAAQSYVKNKELRKAINKVQKCGKISCEGLLNSKQRGQQIDKVL